MPGLYQPIVPNLYSQSSQMAGSGLSLAGGGFSISKLAKSASKVADVALPLASALGYDTSKADKIKKVMDGGDCGECVEGGAFGIGKSTVRKIKTAAKKGAKIGEALVNEFGNASQKNKVATARKVAETISGSGKPLPAARLRALIAKGGAKF